MANVKHIFLGVGDPNLLELDATVGVHHYCDDDTGDLWMSDTYGDWKLIYQGGSEGSIAFYYEDAALPTIDPTGPAICETGDGFFIRSGTGNWVKLELAPVYA